MFTIRTISQHGNEALYEGDAVAYFSGTDDSGRSDGSKPCVSITLKNDATVSIDHGQVFVMNDAGKTVAAYRF